MSALVEQHKWTQVEAMDAIVREQGLILDLLRTPRLLTAHGIERPEEAVRAGWIRPLGRKGLYEVVATPQWRSVEALALVPALVGPDVEYYVSWWSALSFHGLTEQLPRNVWVGTRNYRPPRRIEGATYRFVRLAPRKFFSIQRHRIAGLSVAIASPAKAVIDAVDHPEYSGGIIEVAKAVASPRVATSDLLDAARRQGVRAVTQRLGWLIENVRGDDASPLRELRNPGGAYPLDPAGEEALDRDSRWNLKVNLDAHALREQLAS